MVGIVSPTAGGAQVASLGWFCYLSGPEGAAKVAIRPVDVYVDMNV